jgi:hypothetical protein
MDLKDAVLMVLSESGDHPAVASIAGSVYERLANEEPVDYRLLDELIGEVSGKGVLRALHARYSPTACDAIIMPILTEIGRQKPVRSRSHSQPVDPETDPLRASTWPPREPLSF